MSSITIGGLASGLDTNAIVDGLLSLERIPLTQIQQRETALTSARDTVNTIAARLGTLKSAAQTLSSPTQFVALKASSSDSAIVATATGAAQPGSLDVTVKSLAQAQRTYSDPLASSTTALGMTGTISMQVGTGASIDVAVTASDSITDVAAKISSSGARVSASVVFDGTSYRLQTRGLDTGAANAMTFSEFGFSLGLSNPTHTAQAATDAWVVVDGIDVKRSTNQVSGVVPGLTLSLTKVTSSPVTIQVDSDTDALTKKIQSFVSAYNDAVTAGQSAAGFGTLKAQNAELAGDSAIRTTLDKLGRSLAGSIPGTSGKYTTLASIGLSTTKDGRLQLDAGKLSDAMASSPTAVSALFVNDAATGRVGAMKGLMATIDQVATGGTSILKTRVESLSRLTTRLDADQDRIQRHLVEYEARLRKQFGDMEVVVAQFKSALGAVSAASASEGSK
ncbi:MAG: flagellar filament capping protein FliD [Polyangiaceae bacterium]